MKTMITIVTLLISMSAVAQYHDHQRDRSWMTESRIPELYIQDPNSAVEAINQGLNARFQQQQLEQQQLERQRLQLEIQRLQLELLSEQNE